MEFDKTRWFCQWNSGQSCVGDLWGVHGGSAGSRVSRSVGPGDRRCGMGRGGGHGVWVSLGVGVGI